MSRVHKKKTALQVNRLADAREPMDAEQAARMVNPQLPALLVSFFYLALWEKLQATVHFRDWVMDSGAFSAHASGDPIDLDEYMDKCEELLTTDPSLTEVFALDVIGDHKASLRNTERMWERGIPAIPCYHVGEPEDALVEMAKTYPKIALGGAVGYRSNFKTEWATACFDRVWPKPIHGFGFGAKSCILALPWHSVDATNWESGPCRFGQWRRYGTMSVRGSAQNLRPEVEHYLDIERQARRKWESRMAELDDENPMAVRLAIGGPPKALARGLAKPDVRLAISSTNQHRLATLNPRKTPKPKSKKS